MRSDLIPQCRDGQGERCDKPAPFTLFAPDGMQVHGCYMCQNHAVECAREYVAKLNEHWTIVDARTGEVA